MSKTGVFGTLANEFNIGDGYASDKIIYADNGDSNKPFLKYNNSTGKWDISNDGVIEKATGYPATGTDGYYLKLESGEAVWAGGQGGPTGSTGPVGPVGPTGTTGPAGNNGLDGATGPAGSNGLDGATGPAGSNGAAGATGPAGSNGAAGATGPAGSNGLDGATGPAGSNGAAGATGPAGSNGLDGATGPAGSNGLDGATGPAGSNGLDGATGPAGSNGAAGATGPAGSNGLDGATGPAGSNGLDGATGPTGATGPSNPALVGTTNASFYIGSADSSTRMGRFIVFYASTTDATTTTELTYDGTAGNHYVLPQPTSTNWSAANFEVQVDGVSSDGYLCTWQFKGGAKRQNNANTVTISNCIKENICQETGYTADNVDVVADTTTGGIKVTVKGIAAKTVKWTALMTVSETLYG